MQLNGRFTHSNCCRNAALLLLSVGLIGTSSNVLAKKAHIQAAGTHFVATSDNLLFWAHTGSDGSMPSMSDDGFQNSSSIEGLVTSSDSSILATDKTGRFVYDGRTSLCEYGTDGLGSLHLLATDESVRWIEAIVAHPIRSLLYVLDEAPKSDSDVIRTYRIAQDGRLELVGKPIPTAGTILTIDPEGRCLYATVKDGNDIYRYQIETNGRPLYEGRTHFALGSIIGVAMAADGRTIYTTSQSGAFSSFHVNVSGTIDLRSVHTAKVAGSPPSITIWRNRYAFLSGDVYHNVGRCALLVGGAASGPYKSLSNVPSRVQFLFDPTQRYAYSVEEGGVYQYKVTNQGSLLPLIPATVTEGVDIDQMVFIKG